MDKRIFIILLMVLLIFCFLRNIYATPYDFTITIDDQYINRIRDGICGYFDYDNFKKPAETKKQFVERMVRKHFFKHYVLVYERIIAVKEAEDTVTQEIEDMGIDQ